MRWIFCVDIIYLDWLYFGHYIALNAVPVAVITAILIFCLFTPMKMIAVYVAAIYVMFALLSMKWQDNVIRQKARLTSVIYSIFKCIGERICAPCDTSKDTDIAQFYQRNKWGCDICACTSVLLSLSFLILLETQQILMS